MDAPTQEYALLLGKYGCYFSVLLKIANPKTHAINQIEAYDIAIKNKWMDSDCYVREPGKIIEHFSNYKKVEVRKEFNLAYIPEENEVLIGCFVLNKETHFVLLDKNKKVLWDPLGISNTVKNGKLESYRIVKLVA